MKCVLYALFQCTFGRLAAAKTIIAKVAPCASTNSAHAQPDISLSPATPNVPKSEVDNVLQTYVALKYSL